LNPFDIGTEGVYGTASRIIVINGLQRSGNHRPRVHLNGIFTQLVSVIVLPFIESEVDRPEQVRSALIRESYDSVNVVYDGVAGLKV